MAVMRFSLILCASCGLLGPGQTTPDVVRVSSGEIHVSAEPAGVNCAQGGVRVDRDKVTTYICGVAAAQLGPDGSIGPRGTTGAEARVLLGSDGDCQTISSGIDLDHDDVLDAGEIAYTDSVCPGAAGASGSVGAPGADGAASSADVLLSVQRLATPCTNGAGGVLVRAGIDADGDDTLDIPGEVVATRELCDGLDNAGGGGTGGQNELDVVLTPTEFDPFVLPAHVASVGVFGESTYTFDALVGPTAPYSLDFIGLDGDVLVSADNGPVSCAWLGPQHKTCATSPVAPGQAVAFSVQDTSNLGSVFFLGVSFGGGADSALGVGDTTGSARAFGEQLWTFTPPATGAYTFLVDAPRGLPSATFSLRVEVAGPHGTTVCGYGNSSQGCVLKHLQAGQAYTVSVSNTDGRGFAYDLHVTAGDTTPLLVVDGPEGIGGLLRFVAPADGAVGVYSPTGSASLLSVYDDAQGTAPLRECGAGGCVVSGLAPGESYYIVPYDTTAPVRVVDADSPQNLVVNPTSSVQTFVAENVPSVYTITAASSGHHAIRVSGAAGPQRLTLYADVARTQVITSPDTQALLVWPLVAGRTYYLEVIGDLGQASGLQLDVALGDPFTPAWSGGAITLAGGASRYYRVADPDGGPIGISIANASATPFFLVGELFTVPDGSRMRYCTGNNCAFEWRAGRPGATYVRLTNSSSDPITADYLVATAPHVTAQLHVTTAPIAIPADGSAHVKFTAPVTGRFLLDLGCSAGCAGANLEYAEGLEGGTQGAFGSGAFTQIDLPAGGNSMITGETRFLHLHNTSASSVTYNVTAEVRQ